MSTQHGSPRPAFEKGLHDLGDHCYAYLQPDGSWGYSNAGLIVDGDEALLVDTLFDLPAHARDARVHARRGTRRGCSGSTHS